MGLFDFFKKKKQAPKSPPPTVENHIIHKPQDNPIKPPIVETTLVSTKPENTRLSLHPSFAIHEDIKNLIWIGDGIYKNYTPENKYSFTSEIGGIKFTVSCNYGNEPSIVYTKLPITKPEDETLIPRPPYYPTYEGLTPEQKWIYVKLLENPYNTNIDVGYVFILYYGLERHLLSGDFERAFRVILKLRDVHTNSSFQRYSANALILSAMLHKKGEYVLEFINSLDKEHEFNFWDNLFLMCYFSFDMPVLPKDLLRMCGTFEWTNTNYIKKYPDIFEENLKNAIVEKTGQDRIFLKNYLTAEEIRKIPAREDRLFANVSIIDQKIPVPLLTSNFQLKKEMHIFLETAHEATKKKLAEMRKTNQAPKSANEPKKREEKPEIVISTSIAETEEISPPEISTRIEREPYKYEATEENESIISGYIWLSALDTETCIPCAVLDGKKFDNIDDAPKHKCLNEECRCVLVPYVKGFEGIPGERSAMDGPVPDTWTYKKWFRKQEKIVQKKILGTRYFNMYNEGKSLQKIASLISADKDYRNHGNAWINDYNDEELLECIPEEAHTAFNDNNKLKEELLVIPELENIIYDDFSQYYFKAIMRTVRKAIKQEKEAGKSIDELYKTLYSVGVISSLLVPFSEKLQVYGEYILEIMPGGSLLKLPFSYKDIGYEKIGFFTKGDCKVFIKLWGVPEAHRTLWEYYPKISELYESKFSMVFLK